MNYVSTQRAVQTSPGNHREKSLSKSLFPRQIMNWREPSACVLRVVQMTSLATVGSAATTVQATFQR